MKGIYEFLEGYKHILPNLNEIEGLNLKVEHNFTYWDDIFPNFGILPLYGIGRTGHDYLALKILPGKDWESCPIGIFSEEEGTFKSLASSIHSWLPVYLIYHLNQLVAYFQSFPENIDTSKAGISLKSILKHQNTLQSILQDFQLQGFNELLPNIFDIIKQDPSSGFVGWDLAKFYKIADNHQYIGQFVENTCGEFHLPSRTTREFYKNITTQSWRTYVRQFPLGMSLGIKHFIHNPDDFELEDLKAIHSIAQKIFYCPFAVDFGKTVSVNQILTQISKMMSDKQSNVLTPFKGLIEFYNQGKPYQPKLEEEEEEDYYREKTRDGEAKYFFEAAEALEKVKNFQAATIAYENVIFFQAGNTFDWEACERILQIAESLDDEIYIHYFEYAEEYRA